MPEYKVLPIDLTTTSGIPVRHVFFHYPSNDKLLVILPGRGYTSDHPILHYLRKMALNLGYDVLCIQYSFQAAPHRPMSETLDWTSLNSEVSQAMAKVLDRQYRRICVTGKSLGTVLAVTQANKNPAPQTSLLLLTPVLDSVQKADDLLTLAIIGTADNAYKAEQVSADSERENVTWRVFEGLNHGLEFEDDWVGSVQALYEIIGACEAFLR